MSQVTSRPSPVPPLPECSDTELVQRARAGERAAEAALYRRFAPAILQAVTRLLGSRTEAQDVLQDTFVVGLQELKRLREAPAARSWFMQIAVRLVHRRTRRRILLRRLGFEEQSDETVLLCSQADSTVPPDVRAELALLDQALAQLAPVPRIAWMLRYVEGHSLPEVAQLCGCSLATIKRRIADADKRVRTHAQLSAFEGEDE